MFGGSCVINVGKTISFFDGCSEKKINSIQQRITVKVVDNITVVHCDWSTSITLFPLAKDLENNILPSGFSTKQGSS
jgi:hypothetical protein